MTPVHNDGMRLAEVAALRKPDLTAPTQSRGRVLQMFFNVNLCKSHPGLKVIAKEYDIDLEALAPGQYVAFLNRRKNRIKLFCAGNTYAYAVVPEGSQITREFLGQLPLIFQSKAEIVVDDNIDKALRLPVIDHPRDEREQLGPARSFFKEPK